MLLSEREKLFNRAKENASPVEMAEAVIPLANAYQQVRKYDAAVRCLREALAIIRESGEADQEAVILTAIGSAFWEKAQLQKALDQFSLALDMFKKSGDKMGERAILAMVGITFWRKCEWQRALKIFSDMWVGGLTIDDRFLSLQGALERGIATLQNRVRMGRELQDSMRILQPLFSSSALYLVTGNLDDLKSCLDESVSLAEQLGEADILDAAQSIRQLGRPA
ncbi:MAG: tetratricopeptide repeat protein [Nitrospinae bacterium]|nr:tetratricopeptide repeat protein [Nitrospinota bacterium]MBL7019513.1 tetratricopeptide repeat protein [Nitrospinaceae bacterium]